LYSTRFSITSHSDFDFASSGFAALFGCEERVATEAVKNSYVRREEDPASSTFRKPAVGAKMWSFNVKYSQVAWLYG
jgi:hypothetical protein